MNIQNFRSSSGTRPIHEVSERFERTGKLDFQEDDAKNSYLYGNANKAETRSAANHDSFDERYHNNTSLPEIRTRGVHSQLRSANSAAHIDLHHQSATRA